MKKIIFIMSLFLLAACGQADQDDSEGNNTDLLPIEVDLQVPATLEVDEQTSIEATVSQGEEAVEDADEVVFEIWMEGKKEDSEMIEATSQIGGTYSIDKAFSEEGIYYVQSHVTARAMHTMPKATVVVGNPEQQVDENNTSVENNDHHEEGNESEHHEEDSESHHHGHGNVTINLRSASEAEVNATQQIEVEIIDGGAPLQEADVRLQIFEPTDDKVSWVDLEETEAGHYMNSFTFTQTGLYTITVHVEKDELHEHSDVKITVK